MTKYSYLISQMTWSHSRLCCFEQCPYRFFLTYLDVSKKVPLFFSDFGLFLHQILADIYEGKLSREGAVLFYLANFRQAVTSKAPTTDIYRKFFEQGLQYLRSFHRLPGKVLAVEQNVDFTVKNRRFTGFIDLRMEENGAMVIVDHKSHSLKHRSGRHKPTKTDQELDRYLRQLYLYAEAVRQTYGVYPEALVFNCYRTGEIIREPFSQEACQQALDWAEDVIARAEQEEEWQPKPDYFFCRHLCDVHNECEYYEMGVLK